MVAPCKYNIDKNWLQEQYITKERSATEIGNELNINKKTITNFLRKYSIPIRHGSSAHQHVIVSEETKRKMSESMKISKQKFKIVIDKNILNRLYIDEEIGANDIANQFDVSPTTIIRLLNEYDIPIRSRLEAVRTKITRNKLSNIAKNRIFSDEYRRNMSIAAKNRPIECRIHLAQLHIGKKASDETKKKMSDARRGDKHYNWQGGKSLEPYDANFNARLKEFIRDLFDRKCYLCDKNEVENGNKLDVHHINYDKLDVRVLNLISLCHRCHTSTNHYKYHWYALLVNNWVNNYIDFNSNFNF